MVCAVLLAQAIAFSYSLPSEPVEYRLRMEFDGYLPVLGGIEQKAKVELGLIVKSTQDSTEVTKVNETSKVSLSLAELTAFLYDTDKSQWIALPFTAESVKQYFPDSLVEFTRLGRIVANTAPETNLPFRLPGLDVRHVPDMTCLLLQFPEHTLPAGAKWTFGRRFGDSNVQYDAEYIGPDEKGNKFALRITQTYETFEDENGNPVLAREEAAWRVSTAAQGEGHVWFSGTQGWICAASIRAKAISTAKPLSGGEARTRSLSTLLELQANIKKL